MMWWMIGLVLFFVAVGGIPFCFHSHTWYVVDSRPWEVESSSGRKEWVYFHSAKCPCGKRRLVVEEEGGKKFTRIYYGGK